LKSAFRSFLSAKQNIPNRFHLVAISSAYRTKPLRVIAYPVRVGGIVASIPGLNQAMEELSGQ
jgi:hypothetical protein